MNLISDLELIFRERTCIVGMGNYIRGDDAVGLYIVDRLKENLNDNNTSVLNVEDIIESYVFRIIDQNCKNVLIIDAVSFSDADIKPGVVILNSYNRNESFESGMSTHKLSLSMTCRILEQHNIRTWLLGIIPENIEYGSGSVNLTEGVKKSADILIKMILSLKCDQKENVYVY